MGLTVSEYGASEFDPRTLDEVNEALLKAVRDLDTASQQHAKYSLDLSNCITDYKVEEARTFAESYGLDLTKSVAEQRAAGKKSPGNVDEHKAWVVCKLAEQFKHVESLKYLVSHYERQMQSAEIRIKALQSYGANMRGDRALMGGPEPRY